LDAVEGSGRYSRRQPLDAWDGSVCDVLAGKLGLKEFQEGVDEPLVEELLKLLHSVDTDVTLFFR